MLLRTDWVDTGMIWAYTADWPINNKYKYTKFFTFKHSGRVASRNARIRWCSSAVVIEVIRRPCAGAA